MHCISRRAIGYGRVRSYCFTEDIYLARFFSCAICRRTLRSVSWCREGVSKLNLSIFLSGSSWKYASWPPSYWPRACDQGLALFAFLCRLHCEFLVKQIEVRGTFFTPSMCTECQTTLPIARGQTLCIMRLETRVPHRDAIEDG